MDRFVLPLLIPVVLFAVSLLAMSFSVLLGLPFLGIGVIALIIALPEVAPAVQQTPQSTLSAFLAARAGRCYGRASSLLATETEESA